MDWSTVAPAILSLFGVALGTAGSVLAAYYAHRSSREQQTRQINASLREGRKQIILEYVLEVERCWRFLEGFWGRAPLISVKGEPLPKELTTREAAQRSNEIWYQQRKLALITEQPIPQLG